LVEALMKLTSKMNRKTAGSGRMSARARAAITLGGCALVLGGFAAATAATAASAAAGPAGTSAAAGPAADRQLAACLTVHKAYCGGPGNSGNARPAGKPAGPVAPAAPMTQAEAVSSALRAADPAARANASMAAASETTLSSYEKAVYGGKHVNGTVDPSTAVWVVRVASAPNPLEIDTPAGQKPKVYTHFTVVIDAASHQWIEESFQQ
jgi:hypothetical protein